MGLLRVMAWAALPALTAGLAVGEPVPVDVPSGQPVSLAEVLLDDTPGALWARFRFVAPDIERGQDASADMDHLCQFVALPYLRHNKISPERIAISFSDRPTEFGKPAPDAVQYFETYRIDAGACAWEGF